VYVHTQSEKRLIRVTLKKLEQILPQNFIRINKSTIVNTHYISQIEMQKTSSKIILSNNNEFYSSSNYNKGLRGELFK
ncbi:MAG: LytTR family transcriptional regulator, partial [Ignavibacteriae bacterium]|nr:LytTR family transcriptional regulator [Ignavibacteriota bacterium]